MFSCANCKEVDIVPRLSHISSFFGPQLEERILNGFNEYLNSPKFSAVFGRGMFLSIRYTLNIVSYALYHII